MTIYRDPKVGDEFIWVEGTWRGVGGRRRVTVVDPFRQTLDYEAQHDPGGRWTRQRNFPFDKWRRNAQLVMVKAADISDEHPRVGDWFTFRWDPDVWRKVIDVGATEVTYTKGRFGFHMAIGQWRKNAVLITDNNNTTQGATPNMKITDLYSAEQVRLAHLNRILRDAIKRHRLCEDGVRDFQNAVNEAVGVSNYIDVAAPDEDEVIVEVEMRVPREYSSAILGESLEKAIKTQAGSFAPQITPRINVRRAPAR